MRTLALAFALLLLAPPARAQDASFQGLGDLPGGVFNSMARDVSPDGSAVVGQSVGANGTEAFRWTETGGLVGLGFLPNGDFSAAFGVSADGRVVTGTGFTSVGEEAFRWENGAMTGLGFLQGVGSQADAVSAGGDVIVGTSCRLSACTSSDGFEAFRWEAGTMAGLGDLPGGLFNSRALGASADGSVVVGFGTRAVGTEAFRWTAPGGLVGLGVLPGDGTSHATAVSDDGTVVVGGSLGAGGATAFRWTPAAGMVGLGRLAGTTASTANDVSADGRVVVGVSGAQAFVWTEADGMRSLRDALVALGLDLTGWTLLSAEGVSADGRVVVGVGTNPQGQAEAWQAVLPGGHRWINPAGGSWDVAANWSPASVPGPSDPTRFDLPGAYTVSGAVPRSPGPRTVRLLSADLGTVDFDLADLALTAPDDGFNGPPSLSASFDAIAKLVSGTATFVHGIVGYGENAPGDTTTTARLQVFNAGTVLEGSGSLAVGSAGRGEVFVAAGRLVTDGATVGGSAIGEVSVGNKGEWDASGIVVGLFAPGRLVAEAGGGINVVGGVHVGVIGTALAAVTVSGVHPAGTPSRLFVSDTLSLGSGGGSARNALLRVQSGGAVTAGTVVTYGTDTLVRVEGVEAASGRRSTLDAGRLVIGAQEDGQFRVYDGAQVTASAAFFGSPNGAAFAEVSGTAAGHRAELLVTDVGFGARCTVDGAVAAPSALVVGLGGYVRCDDLGVGDTGGGRVDVGGSGTADSLVVSRVLRLGTGGPGVLRLARGGVVDAVDVPRNPPHDVADVGVGPEGRIEGVGTVRGRVFVVAGGSVGPGVIVVPDPESAGRAAVGAEALGTPGGVLLVEGAYAQAACTTLDIPLAGPDTTQQGRLRVRPVTGLAGLDGSAVLAGTLRLAFLDGYAPRAGDTFTLLDATSASGSFDAVEVTGLVPGWTFEITVADGQVVLTSTSDGMPTANAPAGPETPSAFALHPAYPNPFGGAGRARQARLRYDVPEAGRVTLTVYDLLGREVAHLLDSGCPAGRHAAVLDGTRLASGAYFVRMTTPGGFVQTQRVTILR